MIWLILLWIIQIIGVLFTLFVLFCVLRFSYWKRRNIPFVALKFPYIFGNCTSEKHLALQFADFYKEYRTVYPIVGIYMMLKPVLLIVDVQLIRHILTKGFSHFQSRVMFSNAKKDPLSRILGTLDHDEWKSLRSKLTPAFTPAKIKQMFQTIKMVGVGLVEGLNKIIETGNEVEIRDVFSRFTTEVIANTAIGIQWNDSESPLREMVKKAMQPNLQFPLNILTIAHPDVARFLGITKHAKDVSDFFVNIIEQTIQYRRENNVRRNDYMQLLIDTGLTTEEIAALAFDFLSAGYADSSSTLAYCLYELSLPQNKSIQEKARNEIRFVLQQQHNGQLTYDVLHKMTYCQQIIKETLRKHPVAGNVTRIATESFNVPNTNYTIPKEMRIYIPIVAIHHDETLYSHPNEFIPERFAGEPPTGAFLPFGDGPRKCIGFRFAMLLIGIGLVSLLEHFEFSTCKRTQIPMKYSPNKNTLIPSHGVWLQIHRIQNTN